MKVISTQANSTDLVNSHSQKEVTTKGLGSMVKLMELELSMAQTDQFILENGHKI